MERFVLSLIPVYSLYILTLLLYMFLGRLKALKTKQVTFGYFRAYQAEAPSELIVLQNHFSNQFEIPVLFMITCLAAIVQSRGGHASETDLKVVFVLGVLFILSRVAHTFIHIGKNNVRHRAIVYVIGVVAVLAMWGAIL